MSSQVLIMALNFFSKRSLRSEKATAGTSFWSNFSIGALIRIILRLFQFVLGLTVVGLYAVDLDRARKAGVYIDSKWVWSVVCGTLGALVSLVFILPLV